MSKVILGGGISGLTAAYYLSKKFPLQQITLLEGSSRTGGWIKSTNSSLGYIFEQGPRTIRPSGVKGRNTLQLIQKLGLDTEIQYITSKHPAALNRMIYANGQLHTLPSKILSIFKTQSPFSKPLITYLLNDLKAHPKIIPENDESIYDFTQRRFGKDIADYVISPLICGICAGDAKSISVKFLIENLFNYEQKYGSISRGMLYNALKKKDSIKHIENDLTARATKYKWSVYSFKNGLEMLPKCLEKTNKQKGVQINLNMPCKEIIIEDKVTLLMNDGNQITSDYLISCISAKHLGNILKNHIKLKELLKSIPFVTVCVINLHYNKKVLNKEAFGFLIPPKENIPILGVIFDSCCFSHGDGTTLTVMMGGAWFEKYFGTGPRNDDLLNIALKQLQTILGINEKPHTYLINVLRDCIPQYCVGHTKTVAEIYDYIKNNNLPLFLCGSSYHGVGINDVIYSSKITVDKIKA